MQNVYKEIEGKLLSLMAHHDCSRVLEKLVHVSTAYQLRTLLTQLGGKALKAVTTRHSSHVLQAMLACAARQLDRGDADVSGPLPKAAATDVSPPQPLADLIVGFADVRPGSASPEPTSAPRTPHHLARTTGGGVTAVGTGTDAARPGRGRVCVPRPADAARRAGGRARDRRPPVEAVTRLPRQGSGGRDGRQAPC